MTRRALLSRPWAREKKIRVSVKQTKHRLFLGNVDRTKSKKELVAALQLMAGGMEQLDLPKNHIHKGQNKVEPSLADIARHVIQRTFHPRFLSSIS